jgi:DNA-binding PadR family transcriptional regulator
LAESPEFNRLKRKTGIEILWIYILSLLAKKKSHAYTLRKAIKDKFDFLPGNVSAYVVLYKLEGRGFVQAEMDGNKKVYSITAKGKELLKLARKDLKEKMGLVFGK